MIKKPQLIIFTTSYYPFVGGVETAIFEVSKRLADRFEILIITSRFDRMLPALETRPEGTVIRVGFGSRFDKWLLPFWGCWVGMRVMTQSVVVWGVDISYGSLAASLCKFFVTRCSFILTLQYGEGDERIAHGRFGMINMAFRWMLVRADSVTAISSYLRDTAYHFNYKGEVAIIHNGVDMQVFTPDTKHRMSQKKNAVPLIITTSRLVYKNGIDTLIRSMALLKKKHILKKGSEQFHCDIVGDGPDRKALERLRNELGLQDEVRFLGSVRYQDIPARIRDADVFVRLSRSEGMGNSFVEALSAGIPIVGTPVCGILDIIEDGKTGLFSRVDDPDDAAEKITRLLGDPELSATMIRNGRNLVTEHFSWQGIAESYSTIFQGSLKKNMPARSNNHSGRRVLIATGIFPPEIGGPATYSKLLQDELPAFGFRVAVLPYRTVRHLPKLIRHGAYFLKVFWQGIHADIIFAQDPISVGLPAALAALLLRKKFVLKIVGDYAWEQSCQRFGVSDRLDEFLKKKYGWKVELLRRLQTWSAARADALVVPSEYLRGVVMQWGIGSERIHVIYNAFHPSRTMLSRDEARKKLGYGGTLLVSVGRLVAWKGFAALIELAEKLYGDIPDLRLVIIGSGPEHEHLALKIRQRGVEKIVSLAGNLNHDDVLAALIAGDVFILNTGYEGFSHTLLEAMAMGIPVATTRVGGNTEIIRDRENGLFFGRDNVDEMREIILRIVRDKSVGDMLVRHGQEKVTSFSSGRMLGEISTLLKTI